MTWGKVAAGVGSLAGGYLSAKGAKEAGKEKAGGEEAASRLIFEQAEDARRMIFKTIPIAERNIRAGTQAGLDVLGQSIQPRVDLARGGNIAAQEALLAGLPMREGAILGTGVDYSQLQPFQGGQIPDINYQLPEYESAVDPFQEEIAQSEAARQQEAATGNQISDTVTSLYRELLGRDPDPSGLAIYSRTITEGGDLVLDRGVQKARRAIMKSQEYKDKPAQAQQTNVVPGMLGRGV